MRTNDFYRLKEITYLLIIIFLAMLLSGCESNNVSYRIKDDFGGTYYAKKPVEYSQPSDTNSYSQTDETSSVDNYASYQDQATDTTSYTVQRGETLFSISRKYGINPQELASVNNVNLNYHVKIGERIQVPASSSDTQSGSALAQADTTVDTQPSSSATSTSEHLAERSYAQQKPLPVLTASSAITYAVHTVQIGDTVSNISEKYNVSESSLCKINGLNRNTNLQPGTKIKIPVN